MSVYILRVQLIFRDADKQLEEIIERSSLRNEIHQPSTQQYAVGILDIYIFFNYLFGLLLISYQ